jgi:hypothetical protein
MSIKTTEKLDRRARTQELREYHQETFESLGIPEAFYVPTMVYKPIGKDSKHFSLFPSQLKRKEDIYVEFVSKEMESEDPTRTLYKWKFNPFWNEEYEEVESDRPEVSERYLIPVSELVKVTTSGKSQPAKQLEFNGFDEIMNPDQDAPFDQLTIRDLAAILLKKPVSQKKWLNDLIKD